MCADGDAVDVYKFSCVSFAPANDLDGCSIDPAHAGRMAFRPFAYSKVSIILVFSQLHWSRN